MKQGQLLIVGVVVVVLLLFGGSYLSGRGGPSGNELLIPVSAADHIKGNENASVTLLEYSDFQCPACGAYFPLVSQVVSEYGDRINFVYRHFPLTSIHPQAHLAARAAEAAGKQGAFWEMHDLLFENQSVWSATPARDIFVGYAADLGLDAAQFQTDLDSEEIRAIVDEQTAGAFSNGLNATPTFFLNSEQIRGPQSVDEFRAVIEEALGQEPI